MAEVIQVVPVQQPVRATGTAALVSTLGFLPVFLVAAQSSLVRSELRFDEAQLGLLVSVFYVSAAATSALSGRTSERLGPRRAMLLSAAAVAVVLLLIGGAAYSLRDLVILLACAGVVNGLAQTSADLSVARGVPERVRSFAFGVKTSCVPLATLVAGVAIPAVGVRYGWRWSFAIVSVLAGVAVALAPRADRFADPPRTDTTPGRPDASALALLLLALVGALGTGAINTLGAFYVDAGVARGLSPSAAGWWLAAGSAGAVTVRVVLGAAGDRLPGGHLRSMGVLLAGGAAGVALLGFEGSVGVLALGTVLAFAAGGGWAGLFLTAVVRANPTAPAAATGVIMTGEHAGSLIGPLAFGALVTGGSYSAGWWSLAGVLMLAAVLLGPARRSLRR
jgi:MFS family permease